MKQPFILQNEEIVEDVQKKVEEIVNYLISLDMKDDLQPGLFTGSAGISLFLFYYSRYKDSEYIAQKAMDFLSHSIKNINNNFYHNFCGGGSGICWCIQHLISNGFINNENGDINNYFDKYLCHQAFLDSTINYFDFLHGAIGTSIYLLKRIDIAYVLEFEKQMISRLNEVKIIEDGSYLWEFKLGNKYNISLSHGMASICVFLSMAYELDICRTIVFDLLEKSFQYILSQEIKNMYRISMFPTFSLFANDSRHDFLQSRLGWCYGDLGIGMALWKYSKVINNKILEQKAIEIFLFSSQRRNLAQNFVIDGGICHGTAGIALFFKRMFSNTGRQEFYEVANYWIKQTLLISKYEDGIIGYKADGKKRSIDFLNGISGIGLTLLSFLCEEDMNWDESILLS